MTQEEHDKDMIESIEMWLRENELQYVEKELAWLEELRTRLFDGSSSETPNNLEEAAEEYLQKVKAVFLRTLEHPTAKDAFIAGAKWESVQMMKEAVEGEVMTNGFYPYEPRVVASIPGTSLNFGDKVRIIIVKE